MRESIRKSCEERDFFWEVRRYNGWVMDALVVHMVKDSLLHDGSPPTPENMRAWKDWWTKHKDSAEFIQLPRQSLE